jgi:hypothetical protein
MAGCADPWFPNPDVCFAQPDFRGSRTLHFNAQGTAPPEGISPGYAPHVDRDHVIGARPGRLQ